ncbi:hypothetical protein PF672P2_00072 [Parabacteroides phage PF672P2]|nr:hypothetical protein PF672P1_00029 [Parabacteroides phage PF672P1]WAX17209.1 hypothetical protein PF672P2_00072 [Parabacteroides phage PF672P2]
MSKNEKVIRTLHSVLSPADGTGRMLKAGLHVYDRLFKYISHLSAKVQLDIVIETTMIAYDSRIEAFNHIISYDSKGNGCDSIESSGSGDTPIQNSHDVVILRNDSDI